MANRVEIPEDLLTAMLSVAHAVLIEDVRGTLPENFPIEDVSTLLSYGIFGVPYSEVGKEITPPSVSA